MDEWMNNPALENLDPAKLELIRTAAAQTRGKTGRNLAPVMMSLISGANRRGIRFTPEEIALILDILKEGKPPEEQAQIDRMVQMVQSLQNQHR